MWVKTGVEQMLSWIERKKQPTFRSEHTLVQRVLRERFVQSPKDRVTLRHVFAHLGCSDVEARTPSEKDREGNMAADEQAKEGAEESEPAPQMTNECVCEEGT